jgi:transcriptional regulator with XRE-family HTH domain
MKIIRHARVRAGFTQQELARRAGITQPALARIEKNRAVPRYNTVIRLLAECGMTLEALPAEGRGIDRSTIRRMLELTPRERLDVAAQEARALAQLRPRRRRR